MYVHASEVVFSTGQGAYILAFKLFLVMLRIIVSLGSARGWPGSVWVSPVWLEMYNALSLPLSLSRLLAQLPSSWLHVDVWRMVCSATICPLGHVGRAGCAFTLAGVCYVAASDSVSIPAISICAGVRFEDHVTFAC